MKRAGTIAVCLAGGLLLLPGLRAEDAVLPGNPYAVVVARNIFGLNPPPVVDPNAVVVEPPVKIVPNGIMSIFGQLQVLFKVAAKPGGKDASYILIEGQRQDEIEVVKINEKAGIVTFNNHGIVQELPLVITPPSSTPAPATPSFTVGSPAAPGFTPAGAGGNNPFTSRFGNRGGRNGNNFPPGNDGSGLRSVPTRNGSQMSQAGTTMTAEENAIWIEAQREKYKSENNPISNILPPTVLTPLLNDKGNTE